MPTSAQSAHSHLQSHPCVSHSLSMISRAVNERSGILKPRTSNAMTKILNTTVEHELSMERTAGKPAAPEVDEANGASEQTEPASRAKRRHRRLHCSTSGCGKPARKLCCAASRFSKLQREARAISQEVGWRVPQPATRRIKR